jgi:hypothetical protein
MSKVHAAVHCSSGFCIHEDKSSEMIVINLIRPSMIMDYLTTSTDCFFQRLFVKALMVFSACFRMIS